jgi:HK97 family phage prohead protease
VLYKRIPFDLRELKADDGRMEFSGLASTYGNLDHTGDVVLRGAFDATLNGNTKRRLLWQHDISEPIGVELDIGSTEQGLHGTWKLSRTTRGLDAWELLKDGAVDSLSIGYIADEVEFDDAGVRLLKSVTLLEVSLVSIPANDLAVVTQLKALVQAGLLDPSDLDSRPLAQRKTLDLDVPFDQLLSRLADGLQYGATEAEALWRRRADDGREPKAAHLDAVRSMLAAAEATSDQLRALLPAPAPEAKADDAPPSTDTPSESGDLSPLLALRHRRYRAAGILENIP